MAVDRQWCSGARRVVSPHSRVHEIALAQMNACFFEPMLCMAVPKLPDGPGRQLEFKLDGYRGMGIKSNRRAHLASQR
jgi:ATP-dependent DNA ligase